LLRRVRGHVAGADDGLPAADSRENGRRGEDAVVEKPLGEEEGFLLVADEDGNDRRLGRADMETEGAETLVHAAGVFPELHDAPLFLLHDLERLENTAGHGRRRRRGEDEAARLVSDIFDDVLVAGEKSAHAAE